MKQALIVVDVQESFRKRPYWRGDELPAFLKNVQSLIDRAITSAIPIAQVFHEDLTDDAETLRRIREVYGDWSDDPNKLETTIQYLLR